MLLGTVGYRAVSRRVGGTKARGWIVYQRDTEEINILKNSYETKMGTAEQHILNIYTRARVKL